MNGPSGLDGSSSLEMALDQAIARRFAGVQERASKRRRHTPASTTSTPTIVLPRETALSVPSKETALTVIPSRLSWRGIEVTLEFQEYAARVARGEKLAPYRGPVLVQDTPEFPWTSLAPMSTTVPTPILPRYPERGRTLRMTVWLVAAVGAVVGALGVGAGATATTGSDNDIEAFDPVQGTAALKPTSVSALGARPSAIDGVNALEDALAMPSLEAQPIAAAASVADPVSPTPLPAAARGHVARSVELPRVLPTLAAAPGGSAPGGGVNSSIGSSSAGSHGGVSAGGASTGGASVGPIAARPMKDGSSDGSRLAIPPNPVAGATTASHSAGLTARATPSELDAGGRDSMLFSERPSF